MFVRRSEYIALEKRHQMSLRDSQAAYDRLDACLYENGKLIEALEKERERNEMMQICMVDTLREALNLNQATGTVTAIDSSGITVTARPPIMAPPGLYSEPEMPAVISEAIKDTFPGDVAIQSVNTEYAFSQRDRWATEAEMVAAEIKHGASV